MSIIDQINDIEQQLILIRKQGKQDILQIKEEISVKKNKMKDHFAQELEQQKTQLEQEMIERIKEYIEYLKNSKRDIKKLLTVQFEQKKEEIVQIICQDFWNE